MNIAQLIPLLLITTTTLFPRATTFDADLKKIISNQHLTQQRLKNFIDQYDQLLQKPEEIKSLRKNRLYQHHIKKLLTSSNINHRELSYFLIGKTDDQSFEITLFKQIKKEIDPITRERLKPSFLKTYSIYDRYQAIDLLLNLENQQRELSRLLKQIVVRWPIYNRIDALEQIETLRVGHLLQTLKPLLNDQYLKNLFSDSLPESKIKGDPHYLPNHIQNFKGIIYNALAGSPTRWDRLHLLSLIQQKKVAPAPLMNALVTSGRGDLTIAWLDILGDQRIKLIPSKKGGNTPYHHYRINSPLFESDQMLPQILRTLNKTEQRPIFPHLLQLLSKKHTPEATALLLKHLKNNQQLVREIAANILVGNPAPGISKTVPELLKNPEMRTKQLFQLAKSNKLNTLQSLHREILEETSDPEIKKLSLEYLVTYPTAGELPLFRALLNHKTFQSHALRGLGILRDQQSVEQIISLAEPLEQSQGLTISIFMETLAKIGGKQAKAYISHLTHHNNRRISRLATKLLKNWN